MVDDTRDASTQTATAPEAEIDTLFKALVSGDPIDSRVALKDMGTGETVFVIPGNEGAIIAQGLQEGVHLQGQVLQMRSRAEPSLTVSSESIDWRSAGQPSGKFIVASSAPSPGLQRILARDAEVRQQAMEWYKEHGDPLERLQEILGQFIGESPEDIESWNDILEEMS